MSGRLSMRRIRDCCRFYFENGMNQSQISRSLKISRASVQNYIHHFNQSSLDWEKAKLLSDSDLEKSLYKKAKKGKKSLHIPEIDFEYIHKELKRSGVTRYLLWEEHCSSKELGIGYSRFCSLYRQWSKELKIYMRQEHKGGEKCFVDYSGKKAEIVDLVTGEIKPMELFVMCWGASHYIYAEAQESQNLKNWITGHINSFNYFGVVPKLVVPDNLKSGVSKACIYDPDVNRNYQELSQHYGFGVLPARPVKPKDKAKVENGVLLVQRWILARLRNRIFHTLHQLNTAIKQLLTELNNRKFQKINATRAQLFLELDKANALALPKNNYQYCDWFYPTIHPDLHIEINKHFYSVPWNYYGKKIEARVTSNLVEVYHKTIRIAVHKLNNKPYAYSTIHTHVPLKYQKYSYWNFENILKKANSCGPKTEKLIKHIIKCKIHPLQGYRPALGIIRLEKTYGSIRLEKACSIALEFNLNRVAQIRDILKNGRDKVDINESLPIVKNTKNIRGNNYYLESEVI